MFENFNKFWRGLSAKARVGLIASVSTVFLLVALFSYWALKDKNQVLFSDLEPQDAAAIVSELDRMKIPYKLDDGGKKILVSADTVYKTRLKLMDKGVPLRGGVGFEIFDNNQFGMTEFAQKINLQRALQGELARTIMALDEVKFARVYLVMPETSIFRQNKTSTKASVTLTMKGDSRLSDEQVLGIQRLVAAAVPSLDSSKVTILDQRGVALTRDNSEEGDHVSVNNRLDMKKEVESYLTKKVVDVLDRTFGRGQSIVSVDVSLDLDHIQKTQEDIIPASLSDGEAKGVLVRKRQSSQSALAPGPTQAKTSGNPIYTTPKSVNATLDEEYQFGKKVEQVISTPGGIKHLSVAVLVPQNMDETRLNELRDIVAMTVGLDSARGDAIVLHSVGQLLSNQVPNNNANVASNISSDFNQKEGHGSTPGRSVGKLLYMIAGLLIVVLVIAFVGFLSRKRHSKKSLTAEEREQLLIQIRDWLSADRKSVEGNMK